MVAGGGKFPALSLAGIVVSNLEQISLIGQPSRGREEEEGEEKRLRWNPLC